MKAAIYTRYGPPDVVSIEEVAKPAPGADEILIKVHAATVNRTDCGYRGGAPFLLRMLVGLRPPVRILGTEFAGVVEAVGSAVTSVKVGDRVCGYCEGPFGAHAEYMVLADSRFVAAIPAGRTFAEAAPSTEGSQYALGMIRKAKLRGGDDILIYGATGAIGSAAVQVAKSLGLTVTAVCPTAHVAMVTSLGADRVVDYQTEDFTKDEQRYDLVLDAVGKSTFRRCRRLLKPGGIYISSDLGPWVQNPILALVTPLFRRKRVMFPIPERDPEARQYLKDLIESGKFKPVLDRTYPLDEIVEAYRYVESGRKVGNVVISVP